MVEKILRIVIAVLLLCSARGLQAQNLKVYKSNSGTIVYRYSEIRSMVFNVTEDNLPATALNVLSNNSWKGKRAGTLGESISGSKHGCTEKSWWEFTKKR